MSDSFCGFPALLFPCWPGEGGAECPCGACGGGGWWFICVEGGCALLGRCGCGGGSGISVRVPGNRSAYTHTTVTPTQSVEARTHAKGKEAEVAPDGAAVAPRAELFVASSSRSWHAWLRRRKASRCTRSGSRMNPEVDRVVPLGWDYSSIDLATRAVCLVEGTMCSPAVASGVVRQVG